jgi:CRISPR-associated protein Cas1
MNITIIDKKDTTIKTANKSIVIDSQKLPFHLVDTLLIVGKNSLHTSDITAMTSEGIQILLLSYNFTKSSIISSTSTKSAELKLSQYSASQTRALPIAKYILKEKFSTHIEHLKGHDITIEKEPLLKKIEDADSIDMLLGIEGSFSRIYFEHYFTLFPKTLHKSKRSKRPPQDPLNALLSWYYTLFYNLIGIKLISFGFEAGIGFLHRPFRSHMALASDMMELFRADINGFVYEIFSQKVVSSSDFSKKGGVYLRYEGRKKLYSSFREFYSSVEPRIDNSISNIRSML